MRFSRPFEIYRWFILQAPILLEPLSRLLQVKTPWVWRRQQTSVFKKCKNTLINSKFLVQFDSKLPLAVVADSSSYGAGAVLFHVINGVERSIGFFFTHIDVSSRGRRKTAIGQPPLGDGETLRWRALARALHSELTPVGNPLPQRMLNQTPIHGLNGKK